MAEVEALVKIVLSNRYAAIPAEIKAKMFNDPFVTAEHISILFLRPKEGDDPRRATCRAMRNEDKVRVIDAVSTKMMSPEKMIGYAEKLLAGECSGVESQTERPPQDVQVLYELEQAVDMVRRKAGEVAAFPRVAREHPGRIRQCIRLIGVSRRQLEEMLPAEETRPEGKEQDDHAAAR